MDLSIIIISVLVPLTIGFGGIMLGNYLTTKSQIKHSKFQSQIDEKKKWINDLRLDMAEFIERWSVFDNVDELYQSHSIKKDEEEEKLLEKDLRMASTQVLSTQLKVMCLLDKKVDKQNILLNKMRDLVNSKYNMQELNGIKMNDSEIGQKIGTLIGDIINIVSELIQDETEKLKQIEKEIK